MGVVRIGVNDTCMGGPIARARSVSSDVFSTSRFLDAAVEAGYQGIELSPGMLREAGEVPHLVRRSRGAGSRCRERSSPAISKTRQRGLTSSVRLGEPRRRWRCRARITSS